jgi:HK97 gp10 family phage protein
MVSVFGKALKAAGNTVRITEALGHHPGTVLHAIETAEHIQHARHALPHLKESVKEFGGNPGVQTAWNVGGNLVGIIGLPTFYGQLAKYAVKLATRSHQVGIDAANEMVDLMKSRVPQDTGALLNGISWEEDDGEFTVSASAISPTGSHADYAPFVEYGTQFNEPQPFFWNSADETLGKWRGAVQRIPNEE